MEYALDTAAACRAKGIKNVAVTAGFICEEPRKRFFAGMDAANVDLKAFTERFYEKRCVGSLKPVLETLKYLVHETSVWTEITTLLIPGENDFDEEIEALTAWVAKELKPDTPLHFTAFHPDYRMLETAPTPLATLQRARAIAIKNGLKHVYVGNVHDPAREATLCPICGARCIGRDRYEITAYELDAEAAARAAEPGWRACSPTSRADGARVGCRSRSGATRREAAQQLSPMREGDEHERGDDPQASLSALGAAGRPRGAAKSSGTPQRRNRG